MTIRRTLALVCALVLMAMTLAACGDDDAADDTTTTTAAPTSTEATTTTTAAPTTTAGSDTTAAPDTTAAGGGDGAVIEVEIQSLAFDKDEITVKAGQEVTIIVNDLDTTSDDPHNFHVRAGDENYFTMIEEAPNTQELTFTINAPGTYEFFCDTHPQDMVGVLIVEP